MADCYSWDGELFRDTIEEAIEDEIALEDEFPITVHLHRGTKKLAKASDFIDTDDIIEKAYDDMDYALGEHYDWDVTFTDDQKQAFKSMVDAFFKATGNEPEFYRVEDEEIFKVNVLNHTGKYEEIA